MLAKPDDIKSAFSRFVPEKKETVIEARTEVEEKIPVRAKLDYSKIGVCIYCSKPMSRVICCDQEVFLCEDDRFVSPLPNEEIHA
jgi:hypothetical protein